MKESPLQKLDHYVERQVSAAKAAGQTPDVEQIRRSTGALLQQVDQQTERGALVYSRKKRPREEVLAEKRKGQPESLAAKSGGQFYVKDGVDDERPRILQPLHGVDLQKHHAMMRRLRLISQRIPGYRLKPGEDMACAHVYPRLFRMYFMNTRNAAIDDPKSHGLGSYAGLKHADRIRKYYRALEDVCNMSDAVIGVNWWVR